MTTTDGYTVVRDSRGFMVYANKQADGSLAPSTVVAHDADERTVEETTFLNFVPKRLVPKMNERMTRIRQEDHAQRARTLQQRRAAKYDYSKFRGLIILVEFNDKSFMYDDINNIINDLVNKENYKGEPRTNYVDASKGIDAPFMGSVYDYFRDNSNGKFLPKFDIMGPVKVDYSQYDANGLDNIQPMIRDAVNAVDPHVDFNQYDGDGNGFVDLVFFIFAGAGSNVMENDERLVWPHKSVMYELDDNNNYYYIAKDGVRLWNYACCTELESASDMPMISGIGGICHEFSHVLGLPDFYDTDFEESGGTAVTPNSWSVMDGGCYLGYSRTPCAYSLYERNSLGFCDEPPVLKEEGNYSLREVSTNEGFILPSPNNNEYFIIENRQQIGWDSYLPGHGMLVYRVDLSNLSAWINHRVNANPNHMYYELLFAGGAENYLTAYTPFPGQGNVTSLTNNTSPANLLTWDGKECGFSLYHITETDGVITFDLKESDVVPDIASLLHQANSIYTIQLTNAQVYYEFDNENGKDLSVRDDTGNIFLKGIELDVVPGDVLNGRLIADYYNDGVWMILHPLEDIDYATSIQVTHGEAPGPDVVTLDDLDSRRILDYIKLKGVTLGYMHLDDGDVLAIMKDDLEIILNTHIIDMDMPSEEELSGNLYDVEAIIDCFNIPNYYDVFLLTKPITLSENASGIQDQDFSQFHKVEGLYDLSGRKIDNAKIGNGKLPKGVYIINGKKKVVR